jgi:Winged helix DNA-binding domain
MKDFASWLISERLRNQRLTRTSFRAPAEVVAWLGAVQSQDYPGAKWAIGQRATGLTDASVERAFNDGAILRTHILRPTWHFVAPADLRWMMALSGPRVNARCATYFRNLELDAGLLSRSRKVFERVLEGGTHLTRQELKQALAHAKIAVTTMRLSFVVMRAELDAVLCSGPLRGKQLTYALFDERVPARNAFTREEAIAELTARFFTSHGPATIKDFVWWSGLTVQDAKAGLAAVKPALATEVAGDRTYWFAPSRAAAPAAFPTGFLLPNYDEYLVAYKDRDAVVSTIATQRIGEGKFDPYAHPLVLDGKLAGTWRRTVTQQAAHVSVSPFRRLSRENSRTLDDAAGRLANFLGVPAKWGQ